ncbi:MAG: hypothetical protein IT481_08605 [Gammaproteobacteria bacterium]|nr:hypothetical protein [Gammaproteobacteria bacterium]
MAKLPDAGSVFGAAPSMRSGRPIASYDDSAAARGEAVAAGAIEKGVETLGGGATALAGGLYAKQDADDRFNLAKANGYFVTRKIKLDSQYAQDPDYADAESRYTKDLGALREEASAIVRPELRERLGLLIDGDFERGVAAIRQHVRVKEGEVNTGYVLEQLDTLQREVPLTSADPKQRQSAIDAGHNLIDGLVGKGYIAAPRAQALKQSFADGYIRNDALTLIERDPAEAQRRLADDRDPLYAMLQPDKRFALLHAARAAEHKLNVGNRADFTARVRDATAEAMDTGAVVKPIARSEFIAEYGDAEGERHWRDYDVAVQTGRTIAGLADMTPVQRDEALTALKPVAGEAGYATRERAYDVATRAAGALQKEIEKDPARFAMTRLPAVRDSYGAFAAAQQDPSVPPEAKAAAARRFAETTLLEQARVGVPADARRIVPESYVDALNARLQRPGTAGGTANVAASIEQEAQLWGDNWPLVYRDVARRSSPVVRVVGAGVKPLAAQLLTEFADVKLGDIANDQSEERLTTIRAEVRNAFRPLAGTMLGSEGAQPVIDDFQAAGEKLAAYYVRGGKSASDAAAQAFEDLIGHKYELVGGGLFGGSWTSGDRYRIPKSAPFSVRDIAIGAAEARRQLAEIGVNPARDTLGGISADVLARARPEQLARDGSWVTAGGAQSDQGLWLVYGDQVVRGKDGQSPLFLSWEQLAGLARKRVDAETDALRNGPGGIP